jgi:hypothetical protein
LSGFVILGKFAVARYIKKSLFSFAKNLVHGKICTNIFSCQSAAKTPKCSRVAGIKLWVAVSRPKEKYFTAKSKEERERRGLLKTYSTSLTSRFLKFLRGQFYIRAKTAGCGDITLVLKNKSAKVSSGKTHRAGGFRRALFFIKNRTPTGVLKNYTLRIRGCIDKTGNRRTIPISKRKSAQHGWPPAKEVKSKREKGKMSNGRGGTSVICEA